MAELLALIFWGIVIGGCALAALKWGGVEWHG